MDDSDSLLAIPVLRSRVAPVFNWCTRVLIFSRDGLERVRFREEMDLERLAALNRLEALRRRGVKILICGALSPDLLAYGEQIGLQIIAGVAGEIDEVVQAFVSRQLDQPRFWLPGCRGPRRYRLRCTLEGGPRREPETGEEGQKPEAAVGRDRTRASTAGPHSRNKGGPGGLCVCPHCGNTVPHRRGIPCSQVLCSRCGHAMVRQ